MFYTKEEQAANRELLKQALLSGKYKQGTGCLRSNKDEYCCLGVACDISGLGKWVLEGHRYSYNSYNKRTSITILEEPVMDMFGFNSPTGTFFDGKCSLASLNDTGKTFAEIASMLELAAY